MTLNESKEWKLNIKLLINRVIWRSPSVIFLLILLIYWRHLWILWLRMNLLRLRLTARQWRQSKAIRIRLSRIKVGRLWHVTRGRVCNCLNRGHSVNCHSVGACGIANHTSRHGGTLLLLLRTYQRDDNRYDASNAAEQDHSAHDWSDHDSDRGPIGRRHSGRSVTTIPTRPWIPVFPSIPWTPCVPIVPAWAVLKSEKNLDLIKWRFMNTVLKF